ncbi:hypothetical protein BJ165DRAFT_1408217 [Panaeolus papilionaceus]|nr:hypothetical protein BJ165DRAFT_1408217 [Panaeolus papilionaceus]
MDLPREVWGLIRASPWEDWFSTILLSPLLDDSNYRESNVSMCLRTRIEPALCQAVHNSHAYDGDPHSPSQIKTYVTAEGFFTIICDRTDRCRNMNVQEASQERNVRQVFVPSVTCYPTSLVEVVELVPQFIASITTFKQNRAFSGLVFHCDCHSARKRVKKWSSDDPPARHNAQNDHRWVMSILRLGIRFCPIGVNKFDKLALDICVLVRCITRDRFNSIEHYSGTTCCTTGCTPHSLHLQVAGSLLKSDHGAGPEEIRE